LRGLKLFLKFFAGHSCTVILPISKLFLRAVQSITTGSALIKHRLLSS
jgi:hypothetical protein